MMQVSILPLYEDMTLYDTPGSSLHKLRCVVGSILISILCEHAPA